MGMNPATIKGFWGESMSHKPWAPGLVTVSILCIYLILHDTRKDITLSVLITRTLFCNFPPFFHLPPPLRFKPLFLSSCVGHSSLAHAGVMSLVLPQLRLLVASHRSAAHSSSSQLLPAAGHSRWPLATHGSTR
ncbi:hypothetical protein mRhiFer1_009120 [Rhinolophus ferrumequinum]|uniref:Uncharacterized protein n=1 Tax=Rhinolophus ferrumequinum TaxID=59479 RepID=A0A7J7SJD8_RHIFE|nr:hypothetical protein mRhiFer1_009120 [Rhinolophus ferrumequinum]